MWSWMMGQALVMTNAATQFELGYENEEDYGDFRRAAHMTFQGPMKAFGIEPIGLALNRLLAEAEEQS